MQRWAMVAVAMISGVLFVGVLELPGLGTTSVLVISNLGQLLASTLAAASCWYAARRPDQMYPRGWRFLALGSGCWAAGQVVWTWYEVIEGTEVPFPSLADVGYLLFPVAAAWGLLSWVGDKGSLAARGRDLLDGAIIALSLLLVSWVLVLDSVLEETSGGWLSVVLAGAYPIGDIILATLALMAVARGRGHQRLVVAVLVCGLGFLAVADSAYLFLVSAAAYGSADLVSSGWVFGFLLVAAAAHVDGTGRRSAQGRTWEPLGSTEDTSIGLFGMLLPYIPVLAATPVVLYSLHDPQRPVVPLVLAGGLVAMVLGRQFFALVENRRLLDALAEARDQLAHAALHDPLTGLPNRTLFHDRLHHALRRPGEASVGLLFCDLDDFKWVNDNLGHDHGDLLLREVAQRLLRCVRSGDTVARLGGDEFALLLETTDHTQHVADRLITSMLEPFDLYGTEVTMSMSLGITHYRTSESVGRRSTDGLPGHGASGDDASPDLDSPAAIAFAMLRDADVAMYAAKRSGKAKAVIAAGASGGNVHVT